jgi:hypothetical protein
VSLKGEEESRDVESREEKEFRKRERREKNRDI